MSLFNVKRLSSDKPTENYHSPPSALRGILMSLSLLFWFHGALVYAVKVTFYIRYATVIVFLKKKKNEKKKTPLQRQLE